MTDDTQTKTGFQEVDEEDDFEFGGTGKGEGGSDEGSEGGSAASRSSGGDDSDDSGSKGDDGAESKKGSESGAAGDGSGDMAGSAEETGDDTGEGGDEEGEGKGEEGSAGEGGEGEDDFFGSVEEEGGEEGKTEGFDFKAFAPEFGIELEEGTQQEFREKITEKIEAAKQDFKLDDYSPDAQMIIKHLNQNEGKVEDFFNNENINSLQAVMGLDPEQKFLYVRTGELSRAGLDAEKASEQAAQEIEQMSAREVKNVADSIDDDARKLITEEVNKIVTGREEVISQQTEKRKLRVQQEIESLKAHVNSQDEFMGIKLTPKAKQNIVSQIESGEFDKVTNATPAASKFAAYMLAKYGTKIAKNYADKASIQNRKGHNAALDGQLGALHNIPDEAKGKKTGHQQTAQGEKGKFDDFSDDIFEDEGEA